MKSTVAAGAVVLIIALGCAHTKAEQDAVVRQKVTNPEVVLTGCVIQGSSSNVFLFDNAKKDPADKADKGVRYLLAPASPELNLRGHLTHSVRITAEEDLRVSAMPVLERAPGSAERTLPRLIVKSLTMVSEKCS